MRTEDLEAFTLEQVLRLNPVSRRRLLYWIEKGVVSADTQVMRPRGPIRLFSFRNLLEVCGLPYGSATSFPSSSSIRSWSDYALGASSIR